MKCRKELKVKRYGDNYLPLLWSRDGAAHWMESILWVKLDAYPGSLSMLKMVSFRMTLLPTRRRLALAPLAVAAVCQLRWPWSQPFEFICYLRLPCWAAPSRRWAWWSLGWCDPNQPKSGWRCHRLRIPLSEWCVHKRSYSHTVVVTSIEEYKSSRTKSKLIINKIQIKEYIERLI